MKFQDWWYWVGKTPWAFRWFILLILVRPVLDTLFFLKDVSPFLSPLNIVGVLTPVLIIASLGSRQVRPVETSALDLPFAMWAALVILNSSALFLVEVSLATLEVGIKLLIPVLIYVYLRHFVRSRQDLVGILVTFLYSTAIPFGMMLYERLTDPFAFRTVMTRGFLRHPGLYADVFSYGSYFLGAFLIAGYLFVQDDRFEAFHRRAGRLVAVGFLTILGLIHIHHTASWGVLIALACLLVYHAVKTRSAITALVLIALMVAIGSNFRNTIAERFDAMLATEIAVIEGEADKRQAFHGRMSRWSRYLDNWENRPAAARLLGVPLHADRLEGGMILGIHNDYLRVMFSTGVIGLSFYLLFHVMVLFRSWLHPNPDSFLIRGSVGIILLYSITAVPLLYSPLLYLCFAVLSYAALPVADKAFVSTTAGRPIGLSWPTGRGSIPGPTGPPH